VGEGAKRVRMGAAAVPVLLCMLLLPLLLLLCDAAEENRDIKAHDAAAADASGGARRGRCNSRQRVRAMLPLSI
jgi:hypothetical protein